MVVLKAEDRPRAAFEAEAKRDDPRLAKWAQSAPSYSRLSLDLSIYQSSNRILVRRLGLEPGMEVVDLGCGAGATTLAAFEAQPALRHVWAVDEVGEMLDQARQTLCGRPVTFVRSAAAGLGDALKGKLVDRVMCNAAFFEFRDRLQVLAGICSVLRPAGLFGLTLPVPSDSLGRYGLAEAVSDLLSPRRPAPRRAQTPSLPAREPDFNYQSARQILPQAGFDVLSSEIFAYTPSPAEIASWMLLPAFRPAKWKDSTDEKLREAMLHILASRSCASTFSWNVILARRERCR